MSIDIGKVAYEAFRKQFDCGDLSWEELTEKSPGNEPRAGAATQEKWRSIARSVVSALVVPAAPPSASAMSPEMTRQLLREKANR